MQHVLSPKCMIMQPCCFHNKEYLIKLGEGPASLFLSSLISSLPFSFFLPVIILPFLPSYGLLLHLSLSSSVQHSNPGHAGPFPVASLHNANPTSPTSASMAGAHAHRSPASPIIGPIELIPSVTNPENLPCLPEIPPIQVRIF